MTLPNYMNPLVLPDMKGSSDAYQAFYLDYMGAQLYQNFLVRLISCVAAKYEEAQDYDWDKNFDGDLLDFPTSPLGETEIARLKESVKEGMKLTKDYYLILEHAAVQELTALTIAFERYLRQVFMLLLESMPERLAEALKLSKEDQITMLRNMIDGQSPTKAALDEMLSRCKEIRALDFSRSKNILSGTEEVVNQLSQSAREEFYRSVDFADTKTKLGDMVKLRNTHIHNAGFCIDTGSYKPVLGLFTIDEFRGVIVNLVPALDSAVVKTIAEKQTAAS